MPAAGGARGVPSPRGVPRTILRAWTWFRSAVWGWSLDGARSQRAGAWLQGGQNQLLVGPALVGIPALGNPPTPDSSGVSTAPPLLSGLFPPCESTRPPRSQALRERVEV